MPFDVRYGERRRRESAADGPSAAIDRLVIVPALLLQLADGAAAATLTHPVAVCPRSQAQEIVVCGSRSAPSPYRLPKLSDRYEAKRIRAEGDVIPGVHMRAHVEEDHQAYGFASKKLLITFSIPF